MDPFAASTIATENASELLRSFVRGERARALRAQLGAQHPEASAEEVEDAVQYACKSFLDEAEELTDPGQVYAWIRTAAHRALNRTAQHRTREIAVDPLDGGLEESASEEPTPEEAVIAQEDKGEIGALVHEVIADLPQRHRQVLALHAAGLRRPEIASRLRLTERAVKRDLLEVMEEARAAIAQKAGGGCLRGEPLVLRLAYGLATSAEQDQARQHLRGCRRCGVLWERLDAWREKAAVLLPATPVVEQASPGLLGRLAHRAAEGLGSVKQQVLGGTVQAKQQAATAYYRAVDPTPLAGVRPGTVAAVLLSCATIGGGAATYCAQNHLDPLGAATGLIGGGEVEPDPPSKSPAPETTESTPVTPAPTPVESEQPEVSEEPTRAVEAEPQPAPKPPPPPPPEQSFEPASPNYPATEAHSEYPPESHPAESARPAPASGGGAPQFGGP